ncbi:MAG: hypothetical protein EAZ08_08790 [Cytophagales bacterium]|nr:MAG: hypothetical protein EAZ08_08790 [Cytophagales bacterium]
MSIFFLSLNSLLLTCAIYLLYSRSRDSPLKKYFFIGLVIKLLAGTAVAFIYQYYYKEGDVLYTFHQGELLRQLLLENPIDFWKFPHTGTPLAGYYFGDFKDLNSRLLFFVKIIALINTLTFNNLWLTSLWFSLFSFVGFWYVANVLARLFPRSEQGIVLSFFLLPSVVFWSSGLLKESLLCGAICGSVGVFLNMHFFKRNYFQSLVFLACLFLIWKIKYFYLAALLPILFAYSVVDFLRKKYEISLLWQVFAFFTIIFVSGFLASFIHPSLQADYFLITLTDSYYDTIKITDADNLIFFDDFQPNLFSLFKNAPAAILGGLFEPIFWQTDTKNIFKLFAGLENLFIYAIFIFTSVKYPLLPYKQILTEKNQYFLLLLACLVYVISLSIMMTVSMPSVGTLVRYKAGFLPFWVYLLSFRLQNIFIFR